MLKKYFFAVLIISCFGTANAANVIYYKAKTKGQVAFETFNSNQISLIRYVQKDKTLRIYINMGEDTDDKEFIVQTPEEALKIVNKIFNQGDNSFLELKLK